VELAKRFSLSLLVGILIAAAVVGCRQKGPAATAVGTIAPDFTLSDLSGQAYRLSSLKGKVVLLEFWATWCPPCQASAPELNRLVETFAGKEFVLLAVSVDEGSDAADKLREFGREKNALYPIMHDSGKVADMYGISSIPSLFLIDREGVISAHHVGFNPSMAGQLTAEIEELLRKQG
jgi:peroxiredoxin